uniref:Uncharacterized protein n=1 Tax=Cacopsylla melanoneura TaxID=428564 RepID=A0A8D8LKP1_9HEMI
MLLGDGSTEVNPTINILSSSFSSSSISSPISIWSSFRGNLISSIIITSLHLHNISVRSLPLYNILMGILRLHNISIPLCISITSRWKFSLFITSWRESGTYLA